jgi:uncharacterized glyoxalase superfamily protein PhnB
MTITELFAYLCVSDAAAALDWYCGVFGAIEKVRMPMDDGRIGHAELDFGGTIIMLADEFPDYGIISPETLGGTAVTIHLHVDDADAFIARAVDAGATIQVPAADHPHGERSGSILDPFGHRWLIGNAL